MQPLIVQLSIITQCKCHIDDISFAYANQFPTYLKCPQKMTDWSWTAARQDWKTRKYVSRGWGLPLCDRADLWCLSLSVGGKQAEIYLPDNDEQKPCPFCRRCGEVALSFAEVKMLATGDERFKGKMDLDIQVSKLRVLKQSYLSEHYDLRKGRGKKAFYLWRWAERKIETAERSEHWA